jgi:hypothetical protein
MSDHFRVYKFCDCVHFARRGRTWVSVAPLNLVDSVYGGENVKGEAGLVAEFGGAVLYGNDGTGSRYLGVWGARKASRFRGELRRSGVLLDVIHMHPPARLIRFCKATAET